MRTGADPHRADAVTQTGLGPGSRVAVVTRPERIRVGPATPGGVPSTADSAAVLSGVVRQVVYAGSSSKYVIDGGGTTLLARVPAGQLGPEVRVGASVVLTWDRSHGIVVPADAGVPADA